MASINSFTQGEAEAEDVELGFPDVTQARILWGQLQHKFQTFFLHADCSSAIKQNTCFITCLSRAPRLLLSFAVDVGALSFL